MASCWHLGVWTSAMSSALGAVPVATETRFAAVMTPRPSAARRPGRRRSRGRPGRFPTYRRIAPVVCSISVSSTSYPFAIRSRRASQAAPAPRTGTRSGARTSAADRCDDRRRAVRRELTCYKAHVLEGSSGAAAPQPMGARCGQGGRAASDFDFTPRCCHAERRSVACLSEAAG